MLTTNNLVKKIENYFTRKGYPMEKATGLRSAVFPGMFNPSAAHGQVMELIVGEVIKVPHKFFVVESCFRHVDLDHIGWSHHSGFFQMTAFVFASQIEQLSKEQIIEEAFHFLTKELNLNPQRFLITIFGGGKVRDFEFEKDVGSFRLWKKYGIPEERLLMVSGGNNFIYLQREGDAAGPRCEIYYDRGEQYLSNRYVEIGSVIFETFYFSKGKLHLSKNAVAGGAFGIERLLMAMNELTTIYEIDTFASLVDIVKNFIFDRRMVDIFSHELYILVDCFKSVVLILNSGQSFDQSKTAEILKKLIKRVVSNTKFFGIEHTGVYEKLAHKVIELYSGQYPELTQNKERLLQTIMQRVGV